jgi:phage shock protein A
MTQNRRGYDVYKAEREYESIQSEIRDLETKLDKATDKLERDRLRSRLSSRRYDRDRAQRNYISAEAQNQPPAEAPANF